MSDSDSSYDKMVLEEEEDENEVDLEITNVLEPSIEPSPWGSIFPSIDHTYLKNRTHF